MLRDLFGLDGKIALVTGGSSGLGLAIARGFLGAGARVHICGRNAERLEAARKALAAHGPCTAMVCDVAKAEDLAALAESIARSEGRLDILVNNAGKAWGAPIEEFPAAGFERDLTLNLAAPFHLVQALLPLLSATASPTDPARIINVSSIDGLRPPVRQTFAYSASKAGLIMLSRHLARELAPRHIAVNALAPGLFETPATHFIFDDAHPQHEAPPALPLGNRAGLPDDIAAAAIFLAARSGAHITGTVLPVSGGEATAF